MSFLRKHPVVALIGVLGILFMWLPIVVVVLNSLNGDATLVHWGGFTTRWLHAGDRRCPGRSGLLTSLQVGLATTVVSVSRRSPACCGGGAPRRSDTACSMSRSTYDSCFPPWCRRPLSS